MKQKDLKKLGYGVAVHFNEYRKIFEVYRIGTYYPGQPDNNKDNQVMSSGKKLKKTIKHFLKNS